MQLEHEAMKRLVQGSLLFLNSKKYAVVPAKRGVVVRNDETKLPVQVMDILSYPSDPVKADLTLTPIDRVLGTVSEA